MVEILHEEHKGDTHWSVVRLSGECDSWWDNVKSLQMKQNTHGVRLIRFHESEQSEVFELSEPEIDALIGARQAFIADIDARKTAEVARINTEIEQAIVLVQTVSRDRSLQWALLATNEVPDENGYLWYELIDGLADQKHNALVARTHAKYLLPTVKAFLVQKKLIEPEPKKAPGDDFDPFLDSDDLP